MHYIRRPDWAIPEREVTPEHVFWNRRAVLAAMTGAAASIAAPANAALTSGEPFTPVPALNPGYGDAGRPVTPEEINGRYNNFYEFGSHKEIYKKAQDLVSDPWTITVDGMVEKPFEIGMEDLIAKMPIEERIYRHRCVEAWSMVAPWIGFSLAELVKLAAPTSDAKFVRFETLHDPATMPGQKQHWYPWPYVEGLTIEEATNELPLMVVGAYGKILPKQFGAPMRLHLPWKYGFKSVKSISRITFTDQRPVSFWEELQAKEYGFWANVNPEVDHPRWSQATERVLETGDRVPTLLFNGYGAQVAHLYDGMEAAEGDRLWR
jgi:sulfoxide reductase catalytic subunit YedY